MTEQPTPIVPKKKSKRGLMLVVAGATVLTGGGVAGGLYFGRSAHPAEKAEDPRRPKLVLRSTAPTEMVAAEGGESGKAPRREGTVAVESDAAVIDPKKYEIAYHPIGQSFTANLADGSGFVQVGLSASTYFDSRVGDNLERQSVAIRSAILLVLSDQHAAVLATPEGKQALQRQLAKSVNEVLREREGFGGIDNVYFTSLVVQ